MKVLSVLAASYFSGSDILQPRTSNFSKATRPESAFLPLIERSFVPNTYLIMRPALQLLAKIKPSKYLEPFTPTGLTGLTTHPSPRPTLIYLYKSTLEKLKTLPESSVYRKSTEALTQHRLRIVESTKPPGYDAWLERVQAAIAEDPERFKAALKPDGTYVAFQNAGPENADAEEWDAKPHSPPLEGPYKTEEDMERFIKETEEEAQKVLKPEVDWEPEPPLEAVQYVYCFS